MKEFCVDLELAKKLKKNGFPQEKTNHCFIILEDNNSWDFIPTIDACKLQEFFFDEKNKINAPTSDEILKELPTFIETINGRFYLYIVRENYTTDQEPSYYAITYMNHDGINFKATESVDIEDDKLVNALAKMRLYLKKEGYIK